jgi:hypothetical protein
MDPQHPLKYAPASFQVLLPGKLIQAKFAVKSNESTAVASQFVEHYNFAVGNL